MAIWDDFVGPLARLPVDLGHASGARSLLEGTDFSRGCYFPRAEDGERPLALCFMPFEWEEGAPRLWLMTTLGLSDVVHRQRLPSSPARLELCGAWTDDRSWDPLREMWDSGHWPLPGVPGVLSSFLDLARGLRAQVETGSSFWFGDTIADAGWVPGMSGALLGPPVGEFVAAGLVPWKPDGAGRHQAMPLEVGDALDRDALTAAHDSVFMQLVPLYADEFAVADQERQAWNLFLHGLLATDAELDAGLDMSAHIVNPSRANRLAVFRAAQRAAGVTS